MMENLETASYEELLQLAEISENTGDLTVVALAPEFPEPPVIVEKEQPRTTGKRGAPRKDDPSNPKHLWSIANKKGPNGRGTLILCWILGRWVEQKKSEMKECFSHTTETLANARVHVDATGQRMLLIA